MREQLDQSIDLRHVCPWLEYRKTTGIWLSFRVLTRRGPLSLNMSTVHTVLHGSEVWTLLPTEVPTTHEKHSFNVDLDEQMDPSRFVVHPTSWLNRSYQLQEAQKNAKAIHFKVEEGETVVVPWGGDDILPQLTQLHSTML